jgi:DNA-binding IclR family transcriptional regulator
MIQITEPKGTQEVERAFNLTTPRGAVLSLLYEVKQGVELEDIIQQTDMSEEKAATIVRALINEGYAKEV